MIPKALHILGGLAVSVILRCIFYCFGWDAQQSAFLRRICLGNPPVVAPSDPVPFSHAAAERTRLTVIGVYG
jgi:hypothetical protein